MAQLVDETRWYELQVQLKGAKDEWVSVGGVFCDTLQSAKLSWETKQSWDVRNLYEYRIVEVVYTRTVVEG